MKDDAKWVIRNIMQRLLLILLLTVFINIYSSPYHLDKDSTIIITDSLLESQIKFRPIYLAFICYTIPTGAFNAITVSKYVYQLSNNIDLAKLTFGLSFLLYNTFVYYGIEDIKKSAVKKDLKEKYKSYELVDRSTINENNTPAFYLNGGLNLSSFNTRDAPNNINFSLGFQYYRPINKFLSVNTGVTLFKRDLVLKNKKCCQYDWYNGGYFIELVDIQYNGIEIFSPLSLCLQLPIVYPINIYMQIGTGFLLVGPRGSIKHIAKLEDQSDYDYHYSDEFTFGLDDCTHFLGVRLTTHNYLFELNYLFDGQDNIRQLDNINIDHKINTIQLSLGYRLPLK